MTIGAEQRAVQVWDDEGGNIPSETAGNDIRDRIRAIAFKARSEAVVVLQKTARLTRRYPLEIFAGALVLGFVIGRVRR
jgi:hypothetical protein